MSYRDIRNFYEKLRALGFAKNLSMDSFRQPNFPLVADILVWLVKRFDPEIDLPYDIESEEGRVALIKNVANFIVTKTNIKLNTKKLYQADGYAVKELLKVTNLLHGALQTISLDDKDEDIDRITASFKDFDISDRAHEVKQTRQLASEIIASSANLFDLIGKEIELRVARKISMNRQYEPNDVENNIKKAISALSTEIDEIQSKINNISATESDLEAKIERRKVEIERYDKRLQTLNKVRPAFLEEFNALETELEQLFIQYSSRVRNLNYLEKITADAQRAQAIRNETVANEKLMEKISFERINAENLLNVVEDDEEELDSVEHPEKRVETRKSRMRNKESKEESLATLSSESDTDDLLLDGDESEMIIHSDDDTTASELMPAQKRAPLPSGRKTGIPVVHNSSDDDF